MTVDLSKVSTTDLFNEIIKRTGVKSKYNNRTTVVWGTTCKELNDGTAKYKKHNSTILVVDHDRIE